MRLQRCTQFAGDGMCNRCPRCRRRQSVRVGSWFEGSRHLSLLKQMRLLVAWEAKASIRATARQWGLSEPTVSHYYEGVRRLITEEVDRMVEMNEVDFSGEPVEVDCITLKHIKDTANNVEVDVLHVQGILEPDSGSASFTIVPNQTLVNLGPHILAHVPRGTIISTDEHKSYQTLNQDGYHHYRVNHRARDYWHQDVGPNGTPIIVTTNHLESLWSGVRAAIRNPAVRNLDRLRFVLKHTIFTSAKRTIFDIIRV